MPRRLKYPTPEAVAEAEARQAAQEREQAGAAKAAADLELFAGVGKKRSKPAGLNPDKARAEVSAMLAAGDFDKAKPMHLVALYEWCHEQVYGVAPAEFATKAAWKPALFAASKLTREEFRGSASATVDFIRWTWAREKSREHARRTGRNESTGRIGWRLQFVTRHLVTDYRIEIARGGP